MSDDKQVVNCYCCVCDCNTDHVTVDDDVFFEFALLCLTCNTVWESEADPTDACRITEH